MKFLLTTLILGIAVFFVAFPNFAKNGKDAISTEYKTKSGKAASVATFAGGCFWCTESDYEMVPGVIEAVSGYTGGHVKNPTYNKVSSGTTGHTEAVQVFYDPEIVSYEELVEILWKVMDPTDPNGQFVDRGSMYRPGIYYHNENQKRIAEASRNKLMNSGRFKEPIKTEITKLTEFYVAESYHQDYYKTNPLRYKYYRFNSGRDQFLTRVWGEEKFKKPTKTSVNTSKKYNKPDDAVIRQKLTSLQYHITQEDGTERPFANKYWDNKKAGIYVDIVSGEPLFSSLDKYRSGTGWPSFTKPLVSDHVIELEDRSLFMVRTEVRSKYGDSHLGHVFADGPAPTGLRYCINSASLLFIPVESLEEKGYGEFKSLFAMSK